MESIFLVFRYKTALFLFKWYGVLHRRKKMYQTTFPNRLEFAIYEEKWDDQGCDWVFETNSQGMKNRCYSEQKTKTKIKKIKQKQNKKTQKVQAKTSKQTCKQTKTKLKKK